jgi:hypothetical protein
MAEADTRDAETVIAEIEAEFRTACKATRKFLAFYSADDAHARIAEWLPRYVEWVTESEPFAASYRRVSSEFPGQMDRLDKLLLPIAREFSSENFMDRD